MTRSDSIHLLVLAVVAVLVGAAFGLWAFVLVPSIAVIYVGGVWKRCPYRTEVIFFCLFFAYLALVYLVLSSGPFESSPDRRESISPQARSLIPMLFLAPPLMALLVVVWLFVASMIHRSRRCVAPEKPGSWALNSGHILVALLLAPVIGCGVAVACLWLLR
jgi:hypothetical protein